jgi:putative transposase
MHVHLVFVTKYRRSGLRREHFRTLREVFSRVCSDFDAVLSECAGARDHVHLLVTYPPSVSVSSLVNSLKGVSSRMLRKEFPALRCHPGRFAFWSPSYFASSCGGAPLSAIREYIESQDPARHSSPA